MMDVKLLQEPNLLPLFSLVNCKHCKVPSCLEALVTAQDETLWQCGVARKPGDTSHAYTESFTLEHLWLWFVLAPSFAVDVPFANLYFM